jgi:hypothetical protein
MRTNPEAFARLMVKVDRAYKHLVDLQTAHARFFRPPSPYEVIPDDNSETGERTYYLRIHKQMPLEFPALIGDVAQNLRCALDHLAWHLVQSSPVIPKAENRNIYFPIFEDSSEYRKGKMRKIEGMTDAAIQAIDDIKPYGRVDKNNFAAGIGNLALYSLSAINVQDKHRLLIPAWTALPTHSITKSRRAELREVLKAAFGSENAPVMIPSLIDSNISLEDGSKLCTLPIDDVEDDMQFRFQIAFGEPACVRGKEILSTLDNMHRIVKDIVLDFYNRDLL